MSSEKIAVNLSEAEEQLNENTIDSMSIVIKSLEKIEQYNEEYEKIASRLKECYYEIQEASRDISCLNSDMEFNEEEQAKVEEIKKFLK